MALHRAGGAAFQSRHRQRVAGPPGQPVADRRVFMRAVAVQDGEGRCTGIVGVVTDITERIEAESRQHLLDCHEAVRTLTGGLAHNLNNIMTVIVGTAEYLSEDLPVDHALRPVAERNLAATERAADLTRRLMISAGQSALLFGRVEVDKALLAICGDAPDIVLDLRAPGSVVRLNANLFSESIEELIANARAASPGERTLRLSTRLAEGDGDGEGDRGRRLAIVTLVDHGKGMDAATLRLAREPFFTTRDVGKGLGLGLSLADGAAPIAGGALEIDSTPGQGTTVELRLPVVPEAAS